MNLFLAWLVHLYTASGALMACAGITAVFGARYREAFLWMVAATMVDATDGLLARRVQVGRVLPAIDGARLDDTVDYLTFVLLPALLLYHSERAAPAVCAVVLLSSLFGFASVDAKTDDHFFTGFPSYWNIVALYLHAADAGPLVANATLLVLSGLVFWRVGFVYPSRTPVLRQVTLVLGAIWGVMILLITLQLPDVSRPLLVVSLFFPIYYTALSLLLHARRRRPAPAGS
jgi:phosphatidylcholine synthase